MARRRTTAGPSSSPNGGWCTTTSTSVQQDTLETFVDRGQLRHLAEPTVLPSGKRIPGLKLDHPRQLAFMHALVGFAHIAAGGSFRTVDLYPWTLAALGVAPDASGLASLRYDLSQLRAKGLVEKVPRSRRCCLLPHGYRLCVVFLKLFERIYAPLTAHGSRLTAHNENGILVGRHITVYASASPLRTGRPRPPPRR